MRKVFLVATLLVGIASSPMPSHAQKSRVGAGYFKRANQRYAKGDIDGAIADFGIAIMADSTFAMAYNNRGVARERSGDIAGAIADYSKAIEINPRLAEGYANRCRALLERKDFEGA